MQRRKVLLDECIDRRLGRHLPNHDIATVAELGWAGVKNGDLLARAAEQFDCLLTVDQGLPFQHDLSRWDIAVVVVRARSNRLQDLVSLIVDIEVAIQRTSPGSVTRVGRHPADGA